MTVTAPPDSFRVRLARSGVELLVEENASILEVLEAHGLRIPTQCRSGVCGRCIVGLLEGKADHQDWWMTEDEHAAQDRIATCCSRALTSVLVLDL